MHIIHIPHYHYHAKPKAKSSKSSPKATVSPKAKRNFVLALPALVGIEIGGLTLGLIFLAATLVAYKLSGR